MSPKQSTLDRLLYRFGRPIFSTRTLYLMSFDLKRLRARLRRYRVRDVEPAFPYLHLGCGKRRVQGWLNVDVMNSDYDIDLASGRLPWKSGVFRAVVSQHVIEHLDLIEEVIPLLRELRRVLQPGGRLWLACPDIEKVCRSYLEHRMVDLLEDRRQRWSRYAMVRTGLKRQNSSRSLQQNPLLETIPASHFINELFHQWGEHKNLFDADLLRWALLETGFCDTKRVNEADLLACFPAFSRRNDDQQAIYMVAAVPP